MAILFGIASDAFLLPTMPHSAQEGPKRDRGVHKTEPQSTPAEGWTSCRPGTGWHTPIPPVPSSWGLAHVILTQGPMSEAILSRD